MALIETPRPGRASPRIKGAGESGLVVVDVQTALMKAFPPDVAAANVHNMRLVVSAARELGVPIWVTQQYTKGLGPTIDDLQSALGDAPVFEKLTFSCADDPDFRNAVRDSGRTTVVVVGTETHVCVAQTALDLVAAGYEVHVPSDAVISRFRDDWHGGLDLMRQGGAFITRSETVAFQWLQRAAGPSFKAISQLVKARGAPAPR